MPYIEQDTRNEIDRVPIGKFRPEKPGDLNYVISRICNEYLIENGLSYTNVNMLVGAIECAKLELYRRMAAPYEDRKVSENGDVYDWLLPKRDAGQ